MQQSTIHKGNSVISVETKSEYFHPVIIKKPASRRVFLSKLLFIFLTALLAFVTSHATHTFAADQTRVEMNIEIIYLKVFWGGIKHGL